MENKALLELRRRVLLSSQTEAAKNLKITPGLICHILKGRREISETLAKRLGYKRVTQYVPTGRRIHE
jgi:plasmid maintenance system antidote protein VapI